MMQAQEVSLSIPLPEGGTVEIKYPPGITAASVGMVSQMLAAHSLRYLVAEEKTERAWVIGRAVSAHLLVWPEQLTSGVMFYEGERITRAEFEAEARA